MHTLNTTVAVYRDHAKADEVIKHLHAVGFDPKKLSLFGRDHSSEERVIGFFVRGRDYSSEEHVIGFRDADRRMKFWGRQGTLWGTSWGTLFGSALFIIPGLGHVVVLGPLVGWIVDALGDEGRPRELTALGAGLDSAGIPSGQILRYEIALHADQFVIVAHGTLEEVAIAKALFERTEALSVDENRASVLFELVG